MAHVTARDWRVWLAGCFGFAVFELSDQKHLLRLRDLQARNDDKKGTHEALTVQGTSAHVEAAPGRNHSIHITQLEEMTMNTDKVIELGKVSEETKGLKGDAENPQEPTTGLSG
jgi:hypothetical protein